MYSVKSTVSEIGIGLFSGKAIQLTLSPSFSDGIWFKGKNKIMQKLSPENIFVDNHNTSIIFNDGSHLKLIEHLLAAIYAFGISNILISVEGDEIPLFDGSSMSYICLIKELQLSENTVDKIAYLTKPIEVREGDFYVKAKPNKILEIDSTISFPGTPIGNQSLKYTFSKFSFIQEIAIARTFGIVDNLELAQQFYKGANLENTLIISQDKLLNKERVDKEFIRHKVLDSIGDLRTFECPLMMKYKSFGSSHRLNNLLLKKIIKEKAYDVVEVKKHDLEKTFGISFKKEFAFSRT